MFQPSNVENFKKKKRNASEVDIDEVDEKDEVKTPASVNQLLANLANAVSGKVNKNMSAKFSKFKKQYGNRNSADGDHGSDRHEHQQVSRAVKCFKCQGFGHKADVCPSKIDHSDECKAESRNNKGSCSFAHSAIDESDLDLLNSNGVDWTTERV